MEKILRLEWSNGFVKTGTGDSMIMEARSLQDAKKTHLFFVKDGLAHVVFVSLSPGRGGRSKRNLVGQAEVSLETPAFKLEEVELATHFLI